MIFIPGGYRRTKDDTGKIITALEAISANTPVKQVSPTARPGSQLRRDPIAVPDSCPAACRLAAVGDRAEVRVRAVADRHAAGDVDDVARGADRQ